MFDYTPHLKEMLYFDSITWLGLSIIIGLLFKIRSNDLQHLYSQLDLIMKTLLEHIEHTKTETRD